MDYEAPRLFTERARKANPQFTLTKDNAPYVTQVCEQLDGIPLAIELAAARVKLFTPQQIAERLDDRFDIRCYSAPRYHSKIEETVCLSKSWRDQNAGAAASALQRVRGETGPPPEDFLAEQAIMEQRLGDEMRRLVAEDAELQAAVIELAKAQSALAEHEGKPLPFSLSKELEAGSTGLPYGAKRVLEVKAGRAPWRHPLTAHTFTIAQVNGDVRGMEVECLGTTVRLRYELGMEWTLPAHWGDCILAVRAKPDTTFALYEF